MGAFASTIAHGCLLLLALWLCFHPVHTDLLTPTTYCVSPSAALTVDVLLQQSLACHPLSYYLEDISKYFTSSTKFIFLPRNHSLETGALVHVENQNDITLVGNGSFVYRSQDGLEWMESTSRIVCSGNSSGFAFVNVTGLSFQNLTFESCGGIVPSELAEEVLMRQTSSLYKIGHGLKVSLFFANVSYLTLDGLSVCDGAGYGVLAVNILGESVVVNSVFVNNNQYTARNWSVPGDIFQFQGGNALFVYGDSVSCGKDKVKIHIYSSLFAFGVDNTGYIMADPEFFPHSDRYIHSGSGLGFMVGQTAYLLEQRD